MSAKPRSVAIKPAWKLRLGAALGLMSAPTWVAAQVALSLTLPSAKALLYEDVPATVLIQNNSGQMLEIDAPPARIATRSVAGGPGPRSFFWLEVERADGRVIPRRDQAPLLPSVKIMPGEARTFGLDVARLFAISRDGLYKIRAGVQINGERFASPERMLEIVNGFELKRLTAGIPAEPGAARTYILAYYQKEKFEDIYLRIEAADSPSSGHGRTMAEHSRTIYGVFNLGRVVRVRSPELKVDEAGNVHVLFQTVGSAFVHAAFTPFGVPLFSKTYLGRQGKASLTLQPNGQIAVLDGIEMTPKSEEQSPPARRTQPMK
ncbi:MAG: hypothetical protein HYV35_01695 [Lentisphaerae bacterium]|nr:hypothetical protein [Lentisphaerota bacterium]